MKDVFRSSYYKIKKGTKSPDLEIKHAINKSDYCAILYKEEFDLIKSKVKSNMKQFVFSYYPIEKMLNNLESKGMDGLSEQYFPPDLQTIESQQYCPGGYCIFRHNSTLSEYTQPYMAPGLFYDRSSYPVN